MIETVHSSLTARLIDRIRSAGPLTFAEFMHSALYDPAEGYYCRTDIEKWGRDGDYRTSPERSELFAATFARYFAHLHKETGQPARWTILEAGAGSGHFAKGVLQALKAFFPDVFEATRYVIDEVSCSAQRRCQQITKEFAKRVEFGELGSEVILDPGVVFSNELLDAFPVNRVTVREGRLKEFFVDIDADEQFVWLLDSPSTPKLQACLERCKMELREGQVAEINLGVENWFASVATSLQNGYVITVDYGAGAGNLYPGSASHPRYQGTLRGFSKHNLIEDVLADPGSIDLTATINWTEVEKVGDKHHFKVVDFKPLHKFLVEQGLLAQLELESRRAASDAERVGLSTAAREMILPDGMGASFQVMVQRKLN